MPQVQYAVEVLIIKEDGTREWIPDGIWFDLTRACFYYKPGGAFDHKKNYPVMAIRYRKHLSDEIWIFDENRSTCWTTIDQREIRYLARNYVPFE